MYIYIKTHTHINTHLEIHAPRKRCRFFECLLESRTVCPFPPGTSYIYIYIIYTHLYECILKYLYTYIYLESRITSLFPPVCKSIHVFNMYI